MEKGCVGWWWSAAWYLSLCVCVCVRAHRGLELRVRIASLRAAFLDPDGLSVGERKLISSHA